MLLMLVTYPNLLLTNSLAQPLPWENRCLDFASSVGKSDDRKLLSTVFVDVIGMTDRQRGIILYCYTNLPLLASPIDNL
jgi:hypothetical protein